MVDKINALTVRAYLGLKGFISDLRNDEKGMEVVQVVLIILIGVLLVAVLWAALSGWLGGIWERIVSEETPQAAEPWSTGN